MLVVGEQDRPILVRLMDIPKKQREKKAIHALEKALEELWI